MTDILDKIDAAVGCQQCHGPLGASPSDDFCSEDCQSEWRAGQADVPAFGLFQVASEYRIYVSPSLARWDLAMQGMFQAMAGLGAAWQSAGAALGHVAREWRDVEAQTAAILGARPELVIVDELADVERRRAMQHALESRRNRNTGPAPGRLDRR